MILLPAKLKSRPLLIFGALAITGCAGTPGPTVSPRDVSGASCAPAAVMPAFFQPPANGLPAPAAGEDSEPIAGLSPVALRTADILGIRPLARDILTLAAAEQPLPPAERERFLQLRQLFSESVLLASLEINGAAGQIDCEAIRANHVANSLSEAREQRSQRYEIIAIVGDALVGIAGGVLALGVNETAAAIADIVGGNLAVGFGLAAGNVDEEHAFQDPRNYLHELWEAPPRSSVFPETVWRFLNRPLPEGAPWPTLREELIAEWRDDGFITQEDDEEHKRNDLLFGAGGVYEIEDLRVKAQMLEELKTYVNGMTQQLHGLSREVFGHGG